MTTLQYPPADCIPSEIPESFQQLARAQTALFAAWREGNRPLRSVDHPETPILNVLGDEQVKQMVNLLSLENNREFVEQLCCDLLNHFDQGERLLFGRGENGVFVHEVIYETTDPVDD